MKLLHHITILFFLNALVVAATAQPLSSWWHNRERSMHYIPHGEDLVCVNNRQRFNRALYGTNTAFRVEAGDLPEFALYMPGMGGNCRFGLIAGNTSKWIIDAQSVKSIYRPGSMLYEIKDPLLGSGMLYLTVLALADAEGLIIKTRFAGVTRKVELLWVFGGASGKKFSRDGDIGADPESSFYLQADNCKNNVYNLHRNNFDLFYGTGKVLTEDERYEIHQLPAKQGTADSTKRTARKLVGVAPPSMLIKTGDATQLQTPLLLYHSTSLSSPVAMGTMAVSNTVSYFLVENGNNAKTISYSRLPVWFNNAETARRKLAERIKVNTPDPFINTLGGALAVAADAIWEAPSYLHGAVAWRMRLNAWRGPYAADPLGWHGRAEKHFSSYALSQITDPLTGPVVADTALHLARQLEKIGTSLFSAGYICRNPNGDIRAHHYDMNLVFIDQLLNHFYWTGNLAYVKKMWPLLQRHLAWEKRNFDADGDGLYDAYAAIWASDALQYSGGGVTHTSSYNYRANKIAAQLARLIGEDATAYEREAARILQAINSRLWMPLRGWYAEYKDLSGLQQLHPAAALWTIYHAIDSKVPDPFQSYQCLQYVKSSIPHIGIKAKGLAENDLYVLPTTNWQPYTWSLNNVALAEMQHMSLAYWQGNQPEEAFRLWKSSLVESMYLGASPGGFQQLSFYDAIRGELYRDFADPIGTVARSLVEGLFGITPDALHDTLTIRPGFPALWSHASIRTPDIGFSFKRNGLTDNYHVKPAFSKKMKLKLVLKARMDDIASVTLNGQKINWQPQDDAVAFPVVEIALADKPDYNISVTWKGNVIEYGAADTIYATGEEIHLRYQVAKPVAISDPQQALASVSHSHEAMRAIVSSAGNKTFFIQLKQGQFGWWQPVCFKAVPPVEIIDAGDQSAPQLKFSIKNNMGKEVLVKAMVNPGAHAYIASKKITAHGLSSQIIVSTEHLVAGSNTVQLEWNGTMHLRQDILNWNIDNTSAARYETVDLSDYFNDKLSNIFKQQYLSPRPAHPTLQLPVQGIGNWCYPLTDAIIDDTGLRKKAGNKNEFVLPQHIPFSTPGDAAAKNVLFTSLWDNYPDSATVVLQGHASHVYLLMAGSTNAMQTHMDNARVTVQYKDGAVSALALRNPETWWPIEQDYFTDGYAFQTGAAFPLRVYLKEGTVARGLKAYGSIKGFTNMAIEGGAATVLDMPLDAEKELQSITVSVLTNDVVVGLMSVTLMK